MRKIATAALASLLLAASATSASADTFNFNYSNGKGSATLGNVQINYTPNQANTGFTGGTGVLTYNNGTTAQITNASGLFSYISSVFTLDSLSFNALSSLFSYPSNGKLSTGGADLGCGGNKCFVSDGALTPTLTSAPPPASVPEIDGSQLPMAGFVLGAGMLYAASKRRRKQEGDLSVA